MRQNTLVSAGLIALASLMGGGCVVHVDGKDWKSEANYSREAVLQVSHKQGDALDVDTRNGKIEIVQGGTDTVQIEAMIWARTQARVDKVKIITDREGGTLSVYAEWPEERTGSERVSYTITLPDTSAIDADTSNGSISIENLAGDHDLRTSNGKIRVDSGSGEIKIRTSNGRITLDKWSGNANLRTSNGSVTVLDHEGELRVETSNGRIEAETNGSPIEATTSNGSVNLTLGPDFAGRLDAKTNSQGRVKFSGDLESGSFKTLEKNHLVLELDDDSDAKSRVRTSNGIVTIRLERQQAL